MNRELAGAAVIVLCVLGGCGGGQRTAVQPRPERIVSLSPSSTEMLFALGLGEQVVGVTRFCDYPAATSSIAKVGGYADANSEQIVMLKPDLVVLEREHEQQRLALERLGVPVLTVNHETIAALCSSYAAVGRLCEVQRQADSLITLFDSLRIDTIAAALPPVRVLVCVGRDGPGDGTIRGVFAAGRGTFYNDLIEAAGGVNAYPDSLPVWPRLSTEGLLSLAPQVIIELSATMGALPCSVLIRDWDQLSRIPAVKNGRVHCLTGSALTVPGPRLLMMVPAIRSLLQTLAADTRV